jgi:DNA-binding NarL/FixJ family response regulator
VLNGGTYFPRSIAEIRTRPGEPEADAALVRNEETGRMPAASESVGLAAQVANSDDMAWSARLPDLSARQTAILAGLCRGESNKVIGRTLNLPESTIKSHVREIMRKLAVSNRTQVALSIARVPLPFAVTPLISSPALAVSAETDGSSLPPCDTIPLVRADIPMDDNEAGGKTGK